MTRGERVVIHAGLAKTGTTYLQRRFVENRTWLAERGIAYPERGAEFAFGHHNVVLWLEGSETPNADYGDLSPSALVEQVLDVDAGCVLLSSETFGGLHPERARRLRDAIGPRQVEFVVFVRRRSGLCASRWQEAVKHGGTETFSEFVNAQLLAPGAGVLGLEGALALAVEVFGESALRVVVYDHLVADGTDLFDYFVTRVLGIPADGALGTEMPSNRSLPPPTVEALRALNCAHAAAPRCRTGSLRQAALSWLATDPDGRALARAVAEVFDAHGEDLDLSGLDAQWASRDREIMYAVGSRFLNPASAEDVFRPGGAPTLRVVRPHRLYERLPVAVFADAYRRIAEGIR